MQALDVSGGVVKKVAGLAIAAIACSAEPAEWQLAATTPVGAIRGEVVKYVATFDEGRSEESYALRPLGQEEEVPLTFAADPRLPSGRLLDVWGAGAAGSIAVERFEVLGDAPGPVEAVQRAVLNGSPYRPRTFAFVLVDISNGAIPMNLTDVEAARRLFGTTLAASPSVRQYYIEASYGRQDIAGQVFGPLPFTMMGCNTGPMSQALTSRIPGNYDHYLWYIHPRNPLCGWSGLAQSGRPERPSKHTWYNASASCVVLVQEPGHNFGMSHSSAMTCNGAPFADAPSSVCSHQEYGDRYDPMGGGCRHMNAYQKASQGWFDKCNIVQATATATFTLLPLELACDGVQVLQVPMPRTRPYAHSGGLTELTHYYLELRTPRGIDRGLGPVVQIRVSNDTRSREQRGLRTWFLDMEPETASLEGLEAGESFADPAGSPRFTVEAIDDTKATVRVEFAGGGQGAPVCGDGSFLEGTGVGPESCAAEPSIPDVTPPPGPPPPTVGPGGAPPGSPGTITTTDPVATACACRTGGRSGGPPVAGLLLIVALGGLGRRRASRRPVARRS